MQVYDWVMKCRLSDKCAPQVTQVEWSVLHSQYGLHTHSLAIWTVLLAYMHSSSPLSLFHTLFIQSAAKMIKESMDKKFGSSWHVVIGEGFGFEVSHEVKNLLYMFFGGSLAVCVWKCS